MTSNVSKIRNTAKPVVALVSQATWIQEQLDHAPWRQNSSIARKIVDSLTESQVRALPVEARQQLLRSLKNGRITEADRKAVNKIISSEIIELEYQRRIIIKGARAFVDTTKIHLANLSSLPIGQKLLRSLYKSGKQITIMPTDRISEAPPDDFKAAIPKGKPLKWRDLLGKEKTIKGTGLGSNTTIKYNPSFTCSYRTTDWRKSPPEIALAHELIHADDSAYGRLDPDEANGIRNYERQAVGLSPYLDKEFTENKFRAAWAPPLPPRTQY